MSRVYEALRVLEGASRDDRGNTRAADEVPRPPERSTIDHYTREGPCSFDRSDRADGPEVERPGVAARIGRRGEPARGDGDFEGKLVAGAGTAPVSLEQYRRLAAALHDAQVESGLKTVMVTSALPREGKTLTVVNLALTLSESYARRVLLIDADLRWPSVHDVLGLPNETGLSEALHDGRREFPMVEMSPRLCVLTSGHPGSNPLAGLTSDGMRALLDECASRFDWVLLDTPPVGLLPDARLLARMIPAVVFVIRAGSTPAAVVERAIAELGSDCILGTVLNGVEERTIPEISYYSQNRGAVPASTGRLIDRSSLT